jgi:hypothetical protein
MQQQAKLPEETLNMVLHLNDGGTLLPAQPAVI